MKEIPDSIKSYLAKLDGDQRADGYLCLNEKQEVVVGDGWVGITDLSSIDRNIKPEQSIPALEGLLPDNTDAATVIKHAHVDQDYYFDIHVFYDYSGTWVLFIDKTRSAKLLQQEQQIRLAADYENHGRRSGS